MDSRTKERVEQWDSRPFTDGHSELSDLADSGFSGAVTAGNAWLFMLNGRIVGIVDGGLDAFENGSGTIYAAPDPGLPLLCSMVEQGGETRAKYYTNETPLKEVDQTLQDGSFTGYIELSERVLSGDYYAVYYGGRRMAAAYIGNAQRLLTGDEAFSRAAEEVGIYEVIDVDLEVTDVPGPADESSEATTDDAPPSVTADNALESEPTETAADTEEEPASVTDDDATTASGITGADRSAESTTPGITDESATTDEPDPSPAAESPSEPSPGETEPDADEQPDSPTAVESDGRSSAAEPADVEAAASELAENGVPWADDDDGDQPDDTDVIDQRDDTDGSDATGAATDDDTSTQGDDSTSDDDGKHRKRLEQEAAWRQTRNIPSIDPGQSADPPTRLRTQSGQTASESQPIARPTGEREGSSTTDEETTAHRRGDEAGSREALESDMLEREDTIDQLTQRVEELERRRDDLRERASELETERDRVQAENQELTATVERLRSKIADLESELEGVHTQSGESTDELAGRETQLSREQALSGTNLFVRYASKSQPTLERAHEGQADQPEVAENLQLEHHTGFDAADVSVVGQPYEAFLEDSIEYRFVDWLTETLLYEVRDTGRADALADLYDSIPYVDRVELDATISLADDDTADVPDSVRFDVVAFDKMGDPLIVANINDSREPATREMLAEMEEAASAVKANYPDLGAAMVVTSSYFDPGALEVTEQATSGGFLSRSSKLSYVTLSRKQGGYHLCLVEARSGGFHMNVPEL